MKIEREKENDDSIVVSATSVAGALIADVQSMALSHPSQLPVLLQGQLIAAPPF
jgi:hypothetical protein